MVRDHRCSRGHTWLAAGPLACPSCGGASLTIAEAPHVLAAMSVLPGERDENTTGVFLPPNEPTPSFSSLVGMPGENPGTLLLSESPSSRSTNTPLPRPEVEGYEILCEIGRGGMGVVYKARQEGLNRIVALKMILAGAHASPTEHERFQREAEAAASLQHPHIVQIFEIGETTGHPYLVLELVDGGSLAQHLVGRPWPAADAARLVEILARAIHFAHEQGIVHRDLKPGNILIRPGSPGKTHSGPLKLPHSDYVPKITDFGLAKRMDEAQNGDGTRTGAVLGTPSYIAPEQASGKGRNVGPTADVYALGAILYELLTGRPPFRGETPLDTVLQVLHDEPAAPRQLQSKVPRDLETICLKCLNKPPTRRYPTALALAEDLRLFVNGEPIQARPLGSVGRTVKWAKRHPALAVLGVVTSLALIAILAVFAMAYSRVQDAVHEKDAEARAAREARDVARRLADETDLARRDAIRQADLLSAEAERTRRTAYALQLAQVAALVERDPLRASQILDDEARCPQTMRDFTWHHLRRLCQREERVYTGQNETILTCLAAAPGSSIAATGGTDGSLNLWDPRTGITLAVLQGMKQRVAGVAIRPDGRAIAAVGADGSLQIWPIPTSAYLLARGDAWIGLLALRAFQPARENPSLTLDAIHPGGATAVAFAPDGRTVATAGLDGIVRIWDLGIWRTDEPDLALVGGAASWAWAAQQALTNPTAKPLWELRTLDVQSPVTSLAFSPDGRFLGAGTNDGEVHVWDASGAALIRELPAQAAVPVMALAFTPDGRRLATTNNADTPQILIWDTDNWDRAPRRLTGHTRPVHALAIGPEGLTLASAGYDATVRLWDLETSRERGILQGHTRNVRAAVFSPDRRSLLTASQDGTARVWQVSVKASDSLEIETDGERLTSAAVSANGETLVSGGPAHTVRIWTLDTDPRGRRLPESLQVRGVLPAVPVLQYMLPSPVTCVAASPDGRVVLAGCAEGVYVWRLPQLGLPGRIGTVSQRLTITVKEPHLVRAPRPVYGLQASSDGTTLAVLTEEGVRLWDLRLMEPLTTKPLVESSEVRDVAFGPGGRRLALGVGPSLRIMDTVTGRTLNEVPEAHAAAVIEAVAFAPDGETLATADHTGRIKIWRHHNGELTELTSVRAHTDAVHTLAFSPDSLTLASGSWDRGVVLWDPVTGQERASLPDHADRLLRVQFSDNGKALMSASRDGLVKRWRAEHRE